MLWFLVPYLHTVHNYSWRRPNWNPRSIPSLIEVNWILDDDGNQKITAIEGMPGYKTTGKVNRGIMNMGLYYKKERNAEDNGWLHHWSMLPEKKKDMFR